MKELDVDVFKLETQDKQHARGMFSKDWTARIIGLFTIGGFLGYIFLVTLQPPEQNSEALINLVLRLFRRISKCNYFVLFRSISHKRQRRVKCKYHKKALRL